MKPSRYVKTLLIDNYDSYTYNLYQMLAQVNGLTPTVIFNDAFQGDWTLALTSFLAEVDELKRSMPDAIIDFNVVLSPGPGTPTKASDFGLCRQAIAHSPPLPILGVCLGHQGLAHHYGGQVVHAPQVMHGMKSTVTHSHDELFQHIPTQFVVVRYHSLVTTDLPQSALSVLASTDDGIIMALKHRTRPHYGVQFHPEAVCSEYGYQLLQNFRDLTSGVPSTECTLHHTSSVAFEPVKQAVDVPTSEYTLVVEPFNGPYIEPDVVFEACF